jgi:hypothetical protein
MYPFWAHGRKLVAATPDESGRILHRLRGRRQLLADEFMAQLARPSPVVPWTASIGSADIGDLVIVRGHWFFRREPRDGRDGCLCCLKQPGELKSGPSITFWVSYEHCVGSTGRMMLSGHKHCAVVGYKQRAQDGITIDPLSIGNLVKGGLYDVNLPPMNTKCGLKSSTLSPRLISRAEHRRLH